MLSNLKLYFIGFALFGIVSFIFSQQIKISHLDKQLQTCNTDLTTKNNAIHLADELSAQQEKQLRLREREVATARAESLKRKERTMQAEIPDGCENAIAWMIQQAN